MTKLETDTSLHHRD